MHWRFTQASPGTHQPRLDLQQPPNAGVQHARNRAALLRVSHQVVHVTQLAERLHIFDIQP